MRVRLETRDGGFVCNLTVLPFQIPPECIQWGERHFCKHIDKPNHYVYREAMMWPHISMPGTDIFEPSFEEGVWREGSTQ